MVFIGKSYKNVVKQLQMIYEGLLKMIKLLIYLTEYAKPDLF